MTRDPAVPDGAGDRFDRQRRFAPFGDEGQRRLERASVLVVGCGATGGAAAATLTRCGVGRLVLVDRDVVETSNLPRQVLFDERHAVEGTPKAGAAAEALARIGGPTRVEPHAEHVDADNLEELAEGADLVLDGTDNLATRYLVNDYCVERALAWVYAGVVGSGGLVMPVWPGLERPGPCLRCLFPDPPPPGSLPTCDTAGVLLPAVAAVSAWQTGLALRWLAAAPAERASLTAHLLQIDLWSADVARIEAERQPDCPCCVGREFPFLHAPVARGAVVLCGRNTVQLRGAGGRPDLERLAAGLGDGARDVLRSASLLRFSADGVRFTVFPDGRALLEGTDDAGRARALYDRWISS